MTSFGRDLDQVVPGKNLGELRWYSERFRERDWEKGVLKITLQIFAEQLADEHGTELGIKDVSLPVGTELTEFDEGRNTSGLAVSRVGPFTDVAINQDSARYFPTQ